MFRVLRFDPKGVKQLFLFFWVATKHTINVLAPQHPAKE